MIEHLQRIEAPTVEPLTLAQVKLDRGIELDDTEHDSRLQGLIMTARELCEKRTRRALLKQRWQLLAWPVNGRVRLPRWPVMSVESVTLDGVPVAWTARLGDMAQVLTTECGLLEITYTAGYGETADQVPASLCTWMLLTIGSANENREGAVTGATTASHDFVDRILDSYEVPLGG